MRKNVRYNGCEVKLMDSINITNARNNLYKLVSGVSESHQPVEITSKDGNAVLISKEDWEDIEETLYLNSIPQISESIVDGINTPRDELIAEKDFKWDV